MVTNTVAGYATNTTLAPPQLVEPTPINMKDLGIKITTRNTESPTQDEIDRWYENYSSKCGEFDMALPIKMEPEQYNTLSTLAQLQQTIFGIAEIVKSIYQTCLMHPYDMVAIGLINKTCAAWLGETLLSYRVCFDIMVDPAQPIGQTVKFQPVISVRVVLADKHKDTDSETYDFYVTEHDDWENIIRCGYAGRNGATLRHIHNCGITDNLTYCGLNEMTTARISFDVEELAAGGTHFGDNVHMQSEIIVDVNGDIGMQYDMGDTPRANMSPLNSMKLLAIHVEHQRDDTGYTLKLWNATYRTLMLLTSSSGDVFYTSCESKKDYKRAAKHLIGLNQFNTERSYTSFYEKIRKQYAYESRCDIHNIYTPPLQKKRKYTPATYRIHCTPSSVVTKKIAHKRKRTCVIYTGANKSETKGTGKRILVNDRWIRLRDCADSPSAGNIREHEDGTQYYSIFRGWVRLLDASTVEEDE